MERPKQRAEYGRRQAETHEQAEVERIAQCFNWLANALEFTAMEDDEAARRA